MDLIAMYEQHRTAIPVDEANRLLAVARPPAAGGAGA
jgi:hypothetical protein